MTERKAREEAGRAAAEAMGATPLRPEAPFTWRTPLGRWTLVGGVRRCATRRKDIDFVLRLPAGVEDWLPHAQVIARAAQAAGRACGYAVGDVFVLPHDWPFAEFFTTRQWIDWQEDCWHLMDARQNRNERREWQGLDKAQEPPTRGQSSGGSMQSKSTSKSMAYE